MKPSLWLLLWAWSLVAADLPVSLRGKQLNLAHVSAASTKPEAVIFLPGDGGWRGEAVSIAKTIATWGYDVYAFDTRQYLESFTGDGVGLTRDQMAGDVRHLAEMVAGVSQKPVVLVGWSQGAGMAVVANAVPTGSRIRGIITLGLPDSAVLGWDWKATVASLVRREPDQPSFAIKPLLGRGASPIWMIHGSQDEYTSLETVRALFEAASEPKHLQEIAGANHRFDGHQTELYRSLQDGLQWITGK